MNTKIFMAAVSQSKQLIMHDYKPHYILESFIWLRSKRKSTLEYIQWCLQADEFLLDSGAFTFMNKAKKAEAFSDEALKEYIDQYIDFINKYDIKHFFEMDIDSVVGYDNVKKIRKYIEERTSKKVIPVWHKSRGIDDFHDMCKEYDYVAVGGIANGEIKKSEHHILTDLCNIAHSYKCKVHGLGYSPPKVLNDRTCPFDTVDSTSWQGRRWKNIFVLEDGKLHRRQNNDMNWKDADRSSFEAWVNFSKLEDVCKDA